MTVINMEQVKAMKAKKERALQYAKGYNVDINEVLDVMKDVVITKVSRTHLDQVISTLDCSVETDTKDIKVIEWNPDIPW